jgi:hypothetical protein
VTPAGGGRLAALGNSADNSLSMLHCASCFCEEVWSNDEYSTCSMGFSWLNECIRDPDFGDVVHVSKMSLACSLHVCLLPSHLESQQKSNWTAEYISIPPFTHKWSSRKAQEKRKSFKGESLGGLHAAIRKGSSSIIKGYSWISRRQRPLKSCYSWIFFIVWTCTD